MEYEKRIAECLENVGIDIAAYGEDVALGDIIQDSLVFVSFIIEVEDEFGIQLDDGFLIVDNLKTIRGLAEEIRLAEREG